MFKPNTDFSLNGHASMLVVRSYYVSVFFLNYGTANKVILNLESKFHNSYLMNCLHNKLIRNDTRQRELNLNVSNFKTTS